MKDNIYLREKKWHELRYNSGKDTRRLINRTKSVSYFAYDIFKSLIFSQRNKEILDIGCGRGIKRAIKICSGNSKYVGIDISKNCIEFNKEEVDFAKIDAEYLVEDIHNIRLLKGRSFDLIIISGTLHHLDIKVVLPTLKELIKDRKGKIIMWEPMGTNPFINIFRFFTPKFRTVDEKPLNFKSISYIRSVFPNTKVQFHTITSLLLFPFCVFTKTKYLQIVPKILGGLFGYIDSFLGKIPIIRRFAWIVIIESSN